MFVSVRLKQTNWARALGVLMATAVSASSIYAQTDTSAGFQFSDSGIKVEQQLGSPGIQSPPKAITPAEAKQTLLKARQALAMGDLQTAKQLLETASSYNVDYKAVGDSPATVQSMIDRQSQLLTLKSNEDPAFNAGAASFLLTQAEALIYYQDFETAEALITQARRFPVDFNAAIGNPDQLATILETARAKAMAQPTVSPGKAEAMKLMSKAQLAMDQERWNEAKYLVEQAKNLNVPEAEFAANDPRPWQFELKIQNALNRQSFSPTVQQTGFESKAATGNVMQASYDPANDSTKNIMASATVAEGEDASRFNPIPKSALEYYRAGLRALDDNNSDEARAYLAKAWENRQELDGLTQQSIQDQLQRLTMSNSQVPSGVSQSPVEAASGSEDVRSQQQSLFRKLQSEVFRERASAERLLQTSPREALEKMTMVRGRIAQSSLEVNSQRPLLKIIDNDIDEMQSYIERNLSEIVNDETNAARREEVELRRQRTVEVETQIQKLVEDFNKLVDEQRFSEAMVVARQASDLAPENEVVVLLKEKAKLLRRVGLMEQVREDRQDGFWQTLYEAEVAATPFSSETPVVIGDADRWERISATRAAARERTRYGSEADRKIWNTLKNERVQGEYRGTLAEAIDQLAVQAGVNIVFDDLALEAENIRKDRLVDMPIREPISLQSALEVILQSAGLVFVVENEVIKVTSRDARHSKLVTETYYIGDLVMPMSQPQDPMQINFMQPNMPQTPQRGGVMNVNDNQIAMAQQLGGNNPNNPFGGLNYGGSGGSSGGPQMGVPTYGTVGQSPLGGITEADFQPLIELIQNTIDTESWVDNGGLGTIDSFVSNLSLIVSQTQEVQDKIQDLLRKLRELNDVQIVVEVRFITLRDNFFERIGIDFDFSINDNSGIVDPNADTQSGGSAIIGRDPIDPFAPTSDLDLRFTQGTFAAAEPLFGGFQAATAANFGFAILSDIEVFFLIQASKGDERTSLTEAPVVTMFNGQSASVNDGAQRPFVTSVIPVVGDFAVAHQPVITILPDGTSLNVTAVVSDDRRFVRLQLVPFFSQVTDVETFTFDGSTTTERTTGSVLDELLDAVDGNLGDDTNEELQTTTQGITVQLPVLSITSVNTVVSVPDGGTVLMGGVKRMNEGRRESGVPFLSSVPYVNRLFKNVGIGHETSNLMMMVTPRIIIQDEIMEDQVGLSSSN